MYMYIYIYIHKRTCTLCMYSTCTVLNYTQFSPLSLCTGAKAITINYAEIKGEGGEHKKEVMHMEEGGGEEGGRVSVSSTPYWISF